MIVTILLLLLVCQGFSQYVVLHNKILKCVSFSACLSSGRWWTLWPGCSELTLSSRHKVIHPSPITHFLIWRLFNMNSSCLIFRVPVLSSVHYEQIQMSDDSTVSLLCVQLWTHNCSTSRFGPSAPGLVCLLNNFFTQPCFLDCLSQGLRVWFAWWLRYSASKWRCQPNSCELRCCCGQGFHQTDPDLGRSAGGPPPPAAPPLQRFFIDLSALFINETERLTLSATSGLDSLLNKDWRGRGFDQEVEQLIKIIQSNESMVNYPRSE